MKHRWLSRPSRPLVVVVGICLAVTFAGCGGDDDSDDGDVGIAIQQRASSVELGRKQCNQLSKQGLAQAYGTNDLKKLANRYAEEVYIGDYPRYGARGCLQALRAESAGGSG
jgi:hypothetical protein